MWVKSWLPFLVPFGCVFVAGMATMAWSNGDMMLGIHPDPVEVTFRDLDVSTPWVKIEVMAHYEAMVTQTIPANLISDEQKLYLFGAFPVYSTEERAVPLLVRTSRPPDRMVTYEVMTVEGKLSVPTSDKVPFSTEEMIGKRTGYYFSDSVLLLEAVRVITEDGVFEEP